MKKLKNRIINLGLSFKKEITILILANLALIAAAVILFTIMHNILLSLSFLFAAAAFTYFFLSRYSSMEEKNQQDNIKDFVTLFTFFKTYIQNDYNVYQALIEISHFADPFSLERLNNLISDMDKDKSVEPFIRFAKEYKLLLIEQLMISIYQMIEQGNNSSYMREFDILFTKLSEEQYRKEVEAKNKKLSRLTIFPLAGSGFLIILITIGVVQIIGDMLNGL